MAKLLTRILVFFFIAGCSSHTTVSRLADSGGTQLSAEQILELVENNTMALQSFTVSGSFYFDHSGKLFGRDINDNEDAGRWDVSNTDELCLKLENWWHGDLICYQLWTDNTTFHLANRDGLLLFTAKQSNGDTYNLYVETQKKSESFRNSIRTQKKQQNEEPQKQTLPPSDSIEKDQSNISSSTLERELGSSFEKDAETTIRLIARNCPDCNLAFSKLQYADLEGANLENANLMGTDLTGAHLRRANLKGANLENATLKGADMPGANLSNCNLNNADLRDANLYKADLSGAHLVGAKLDGVKGFTIK